MIFTSPSRRAFTLIEIMVSIAIFALVIGAIYASWMALIRSSQVARDVAAQAQRQRVTLRTIEDSLMAIQSFQASPQYYSFIVENGDSPVFSFAARVPEVFPRNGKFINPSTGRDYNLRRLDFRVESDADGVKNLVLRQNPILMDLDEDEQKYPVVLARNVRKFSVECWNTNRLEWADEWQDTNAIPPLLRVHLVVGGNVAAGADAPDVSVTRVLSPPSQTMPAFAQRGAVGGNNPGQPAIPMPTPKP
jgi:prepilin-type N-terminal cleavage/methylation domain-containing protein